MRSQVLYAFAIAVLLVLVGVILGLLRRSKQMSRANGAQSVPAIGEDDPNYAFYRLCRVAGFRFIGDLMPAHVHGLNAKLSLRRSGELLFARVTAPLHAVLAPGHGLCCATCRARVFDLYLTLEETREYYGPYAAQLFARVCGTCGRVQDRQHDSLRPLTPAAQRLRAHLLQTGDALAFLRNMPRYPDTFRAAP